MVGAVKIMTRRTEKDKMTLARVFPRRTSHSPTDQHAYFDAPDLYTPFYNMVDISVSFTYDIPRAEKLYKDWKHHTDSIRIGGPAFGQPSGEFIPGKYVKQGITFTSRGCPNKCWFCSVWKREPKLIELEIKPGHIIQDDNLLSCSRQHIETVFKMLSEQKERIKFSGGLEAKLLEDWHCEFFAQVKPESIFFAYDTKDDLEPLHYAGEMLYKYGFGWPNRAAQCLVLLGQENDTMEKADKRMFETVMAGFWPQAMLWRNEKGETDPTWAKFAREWARPAIYYDRAMRARL